MLSWRPYGRTKKVGLVCGVQLSIFTSHGSSINVEVPSVAKYGVMEGVEGPERSETKLYDLTSHLQDLEVA